MLNFIFIMILCLLVTISFGVVCRYLIKKEWRKAIFSGILTIFTPVETFLFVQSRNVLEQTELSYMIEQMKQMDVYAYLILSLYLLLLCNIIYYFVKRRVTK